MTTTTKTNITIHKSLLLVRNISKYGPPMEWYLCKKEHENHIYHYLKSGTATTEPRVYGGRFSPNTCPNMIGYIVRSRLNVYDMVSGYGRYQFEDMNTVKEFCNYIGTIVYPDTNNSTTIDYIKTHFGQYQW